MLRKVKEIEQAAKLAMEAATHKIEMPPAEEPLKIPVAESGYQLGGQQIPQVDPDYKANGKAPSIPLELVGVDPNNLIFEIKTPEKSYLVKSQSPTSALVKFARSFEDGYHNTIMSVTLFTGNITGEVIFIS